MNQRQIGAALILIGIVLSVSMYFVKLNEDMYIEDIIASTNSCYLTDGTCLHADRNYVPYIIGWAFSFAAIILGVYLFFFDKTQSALAQHQEMIASALRDAKKEGTTKDVFNAFLSGFSKEEQEVLKAVREQDGIKQSTLRYRTGMSKTTLSLMLKSLEGREIVSRKVSGKTNEVYLRKKF